MKLFAELEKDELFCSFSFAKACYYMCKESLVNPETVAKMMLLEAENERKGNDNAE